MGIMKKPKEFSFLGDCLYFLFANKTFKMYSKNSHGRCRRVLFSEMPVFQIFLL